MSNQADPNSPKLEQIAQAQQAYFTSGKTLPLDARKTALKKLAQVLEAKETQIHAALKADLNKPEIEAYLAETLFLKQDLKLTLRKLKSWLKPRRVSTPFYFQPASSQSTLVPHGLCTIFAPWNYPFQLALAPLIAAIAAGNTVILKPSELAPASAELLAQILAEAFPPEHATAILGDAQVAAEVLEIRSNYLFYTGSTAIGKLVAQRAARDLIPCTLELGGKCPAIIHESADLSITARRLLLGKLFNAGQTCLAPDFVLVPSERKGELFQELQRELESHPWDAPEEYARIISQNHYERLGKLHGHGEQNFTLGQDRPAQLHCAPRLLHELDWTHPAMQEEIFGPILPILSYQESALQESLIRPLQALPEPLALYLFSEDQSFTQQVLNQVKSGSVCLNDTLKQASIHELPFGGVGQSGYGRYRGRAGIEAFSSQRSITRRSLSKDPFEALPPRGKTYQLLKRFLG